MKLSRRLLIPIMLVSVFAVTASSFVYYNIMQREVDSIYRGEILAVMAGLKTEMEITGSLNDSIMERSNETNVALARSVALWLDKEPEQYLSQDGLQELAAFMGVGEIHVADDDGIIYNSSDERYLGRSMLEQQGEADLLAEIGNTDFYGIQQPRESSGGYWVQFYIVSRIDQPGLVVIGIHYSISAMIQQNFTDGVNAQLTKVGETGFPVILHDGVYAAHRDAEKVGEEVSGAEWYREVFGKEAGVDWLTIDGKQYLAGYNTVEGSTLVLALLPASEYYSSLRNLQGFSALLIVALSALLIGILFASVRRNVIRPLSTISAAVNSVAKGNLNVSINERFTGEMEQLRQDVNQTIARLKNRQDNLLRNFPGVVFSCDEDFICTTADGQALEQLGFDAQRYRGRQLLEVLRSDGDAALADLIERTFTEETAQRLNTERNGRYLSITTTLMQDGEGKTTGLVGVCTDVTDLRELQIQLMHATEEAERASRAKSEFLSRMSHEIRTPMNAIIGMTTIGRKSTSDSAKIQYCLDKISRASDQLLHLINDILDMSKIEANKFELSPSEFDFERMLQNVCNVVDVNASEKAQNFIVDFAQLLDRNVVGDEMRISQVLINLLNNAVKFTPEAGQVTLHIRHTQLENGDVRFHFAVIDNGIGIPQDQQKRLFSSFEQADGSITRHYGGTGLGLPISKSIVQMMGGELTVESAPGEGSRFSFAVDMKWGGEKNMRDWAQRLPGSSLRTLVIDDNQDVCLYFEEILKNYGFGCDTALSGPEGIQKMEAALAEGKPYSLIFVDWMMPGMNGIEAARHIKTLAPPETIVIMISVADWTDIEREAKGIGVDKFLAKPVLPTVLFHSITEWLNATEVQSGSFDEDAHMAFAGKTMLLAEDIDINREIIIGMLEGTGIQIECAADGRAAYEMYAARPGGYDVVLMDIQMPGMDGYEATARIRQSGLAGAETLPIIAMTANAFSSDVEKCLNAGMNDHVAKPVDIADLYQKLRMALGV